MDFELDSEHEMIRQTVRDFAEKEVRPVAAHVDKTGEFPKATVAKMAGLGFLGVAIPSEYEGAGLDALALAIGIEEMARVCGSHALIMAAHNSLCTGHIFNFGSEDQRKRFAVPLAKGEKIGAWSLTEPEAGSDAGGTQTVARLDGELAAHGAEQPRIPADADHDGVHQSFTRISWTVSVPMTVGQMAPSPSDLYTS